MANFVPVPSFSTVPDFNSNPFVTGFEMKYVSVSQFTVGAGSARALTSSNVLAYPNDLPALPAVITVDVTTVGLNGCFPFSLASLALANTTTFPVYAIGNSGGTTAGSLNPVNGAVTSVVVATGSNFLPAGYDSYRRIGYVFINTSNQILAFIQSGNGNARKYALEIGVSVLSGGTAGSYTAIDLTALNAVLPKKMGLDALFNCLLVAGAAGDAVSFSYNSASTGAQAIVESSSNAAPMTVPFRTVCGQDATTGDAVLYYKTTGGTVNLSLVGFEDDLGLQLA